MSSCVDKCFTAMTSVPSQALNGIVTLASLATTIYFWTQTLKAKRAFNVCCNDIISFNSSCGNFNPIDRASFCIDQISNEASNAVPALFFTTVTLFFVATTCFSILHHRTIRRIRDLDPEASHISMV